MKKRRSSTNKKKKKNTISNHKAKNLKSVRKKKKSNKKPIKFINRLKKAIKASKKRNLSKRIERKEEIARRKEELGISEKKKNIKLKIVVLLITLVIIASLLLVLFKRKDSNIEFPNVNLKEYKELYERKELQYVYIKSDNCTYCSLLEPYLLRLETDYNIEFKLLNISNLSKEKLKELTVSNSAFEDDWKAPILISIKNGKEVSNVKGYKEYTVLKKFVEYSENPSDINSFINISISKYLSILKSNELSVIYIGRSKSNSCKRFAPILEKVSTAKDFKVYYLNTDTMDTEKDWDSLKNSNKIFEGTWFMPVILITKDNVIIDYKMEGMNEMDLTNFFNRNKM